MQEQRKIVVPERNIQAPARRAKYDKSCACIINFSWLSHDFTVLNFYMLRDFVLNTDHQHNFREILFVISGSGTIKVDGTNFFELKKGDLFYMDAGVKHRLIPDPGKPMRVCVTSFTMSPNPTSDKIPAELIEDEEAMLRCIEGNRYMTGEDGYGCGRILRSIVDAMDMNHCGEFIKIKNSISSYILAAFQSFTRLPERPNFSDLLASAPSFNVMKIIQYMRRHYTEGITLPSVAEALHYSPRQCQRIIYECMGISFTELLLDLQLTHSKKLLADTNETLEEIAEHSGFKSGKSFSRQFKDREGVTPYRYRKSLGE